jgi:hypothetical protein
MICIKWEMIWKEEAFVKSYAVSVDLPGVNTKSHEGLIQDSLVSVLSMNT